VLGDDFADPLGRPAPAQLADVLPDPLHPLMTGPVPGEKQLRDRTADRVTPADQAIPVKRRSVSKGRRLRDDRFIEIKERCGTPAAGCGVTSHSR